MWAVDTSWLVALFDSGDEFHGTARKEAAGAGDWLLNPLILAEFLDGIRRRGGRALLLQVLEDLQRTQQVRWVQAPKAAAIGRLVTRHGGISWHDASAIATALDEGAGLRTFDKDQRKAFEALA